MSATREALRNDLLLEVLGKPIHLNAVDQHVKLGGLTGTQRFAAWHHSLDRSLHEISHKYVKHHGDHQKWMYAVWLSLTAKGELLARSLEENDIDGYRPKATGV